MSVVTTHSEHETEEAGRAFARELAVGAVVLIDGPLGAGKTAFVRGMARGLGSNPTDVTSPTFTILHEYAGPHVLLFHADLYRLSEREVDELGLDDVAVEGILVVEWPDRWAAPPREAVHVSIAKGDGDTRHITVPDGN
ncbi:MAG: tRNA (adenosine(37)-N6)-threonylcarbamoyltransferase complex ATPase subunit type 1 TsaE [Acidobacteria bacterium]|nr:MAG: tRNA (adenosine(37)-N6)-threonylcarbamoyltransferase complex ATPase subunit type 1 TsaE [Acidobacteriota bacterium]